MNTVWGNDKFQEYYHERNKKDKEKIDGILDRCGDRQRWARMDMVTERLTCHFKRVHKLCSNEDFPLSAYPLLVQVLGNAISKGFKADFDTILGECSRA